MNYIVVIPFLFSKTFYETLQTSHAASSWNLICSPCLGCRSTFFAFLGVKNTRSVCHCFSDRKAELGAMSPPLVLYPDELSYSASGPCGQQFVQSYQNCTTKFYARTAGNHISDVLVFNFHRDPPPHPTHTLEPLWMARTFGARPLYSTEITPCRLPRTCMLSDKIPHTV